MHQPLLLRLDLLKLIDFGFLQSQGELLVDNVQFV